METVTLTIDGRQVTVEKGKTVLQAAIESGISVPYYCYHPGIGVDGSCRVCIVKIEKMPKLQTSCSTVCTDGMIVSTRTPDVVDARASVFEFLLINHPLDCPVCDKGGECPLQDFSYTFGPDQSRMEFPRRVFDGEGVRGDVDFGPTLMLNRQRCILCTRCVRFMRDVDSDAQINIIDRGYGSEIATFQEEGVHSLLSGNLMDVCPVGAITTRDYRFKSRPWDNPNAADTICTQCEKGCNITAWIKAKPEWAKGSRLIRFTPRFQPEVNGYWMCDIGRFEYHWIEGDDRLHKPLVREEGGQQQPATWHDLHAKLADRLQSLQRGLIPDQTPLQFLISAHAAHEEMFLVRRLAEDLLGAEGLQTIAVGWRYGEKSQPEGAKFKVPPVDAPNVNGARLLGLVAGAVGDETRTADVSALRQAVEAGRVAALYVLDPGCEGTLGDVQWVVDARNSGALKLLIVQGVLLTPLARAADFVLPGAWYSRKGSVLYKRSGPAAGHGAGDSTTRGRDGGLANPGQCRAFAGPGVRLHRGGARAGGHRGSPSRGRRACRATCPDLQPPDVGTALAAGVEPVGAVEVGFHVPGPAAGEGRRRPDVVADGAGDDRVERSEMKGFVIRDLGFARASQFGNRIPNPESRIPSRPRRLRATIVFLGVALCAAQVAHAQLRRPRAEISPLVESPTVRAGNSVRVALQVTLPEGLHTQSNKPRDPTLIPTVLTVDVPAGITWDEVVFPPAIDLAQAGQDKPLAVFEREFLIGVRLTLAPNVAQGAIDVPAHLRYQACDANLCYAPVTADLKWTLNVVAASAPISPNPDATKLFDRIAFGRGEKPNAAGAAAPEETAPRPSDATTDLAKLDQFTVLGSTGGYLGATDFLTFIRNAESGVQDKGMFEGRGPIAILLLVFLGGLALNLTPCVLPMIPINLAIIGAGTQSGFGNAPASRSRGFLLGATYGGAMALVYGILGLVVVLTAGTFGSINSTAWFNGGIAILFVVLALAMFDVIVIDFSSFSSGMFRGRQSGTFILAFGMGAVAALLAGACVAPVVIQVVLFSSNLYATGTKIALALPFCLGIGMALPWPIAGAGLAKLPKPGMWMVRVKQAFGVFILATAAYYGYEAYSIMSNRWVDASAVTSSVEEQLKTGWHANLGEGLDLARREQKAVLIDMWATWCKNCLTMDKTTLKNEDVKAALDKYVRIKFQAEDPDQPPAKPVMQRFNAVGLPAYVILKPKT